MRTSFRVNLLHTALHRTGFVQLAENCTAEKPKSGLQLPHIYYHKELHKAGVPSCDRQALLIFHRKKVSGLS